MVFLIVDSSATMRRIIINSLKSLGHKNIIEAIDGQDAIVKLNTEKIEFVITEWNMPGFDGLELTKYIRNDVSLQSLPVLLVSSRTLKENILEAMAAKVSNYLVRPFTPQTLKEKIDTILFML
ncbi:MAG: response regulator [Candidatus Kapabacteria bacterium]|nr:response regulator [Candidatus Kapabacteria bacterium]